MQPRHGDAGDNKHNRSSTASGCFETADDGYRRRYAAEGRSAVYPSSPGMRIGLYLFLIPSVSFGLKVGVRRNP
jgi:hypothetical protein